MIDKMILGSDHELIPAPDLMTWARWFENGENRRVGHDASEGMEVSTVFLGLDHGFGGPSLWFETMCFGPKDDPRDGYTERYATWDEAEAGHARVVDAVFNGRDPGSEKPSSANVEGK